MLPFKPLNPPSNILHHLTVIHLSAFPPVLMLISHPGHLALLLEILPSQGRLKCLALLEVFQIHPHSSPSCPPHPIS